MASPRFTDQFRHKMTFLGKLGEIDLSTAKPIVGQEGKSHFQKAAAAIVHPSWSAIEGNGSTVESERAEVPVFAKPIHIKKRSVGDCYSEYSGQMLNTPGSQKAESEPGGHSKSLSADLSPSPLYHPHRPPSHKRKVSMPLQDNKPRLLADFVPYTLEDYRKIRMRKWVALGGIGPKSQMSEDWKREHFVHRRRLEYANDLRQQRRTNSPGK